MKVLVHVWMNRNPGPSDDFFIEVLSGGVRQYVIASTQAGTVPVDVSAGNAIRYWSHTGVAGPSITVSNQTDVWFVGDNLGASTVLVRGDVIPLPGDPDWWWCTAEEGAQCFGAGFAAVMGSVIAAWVWRRYVRGISEVLRD